MLSRLKQSWIDRYRSGIDRNRTGKIDIDLV